MKILLVCASGMSTGLLMNRLRQYWQERGETHSIDAYGISEYQLYYSEYDVVLIGPQISYKLEEVRNTTGLPCDVIPSFDYAIGNCEKIMSLAERLHTSQR